MKLRVVNKKQKKKTLTSVAPQLNLSQIPNCPYKQLYFSEIVPLSSTIIHV